MKKKSAFQRLWFLHWLMALFYLLLFISGQYMADLSRSVSYRETLYDFHKLLGVIVMSLLLARISILMLTLQHKYRRRQLLRKGDWLQTVALHMSLYFFMLLVPLSGYFLTNTGGHEVKIFTTGIVLPNFFSTNKHLAEFGKSLHFWLAYTFLCFIILHTVDQRKYLRAQVRRLSKATIATISAGINK